MANGGTGEKIDSDQSEWMMVIKYSCILVHTQHEQSAVARHSWSHQLSNRQANDKKNRRSSKFIQNTRPEAGIIKKREEKKMFWTQENDHA